MIIVYNCRVWQIVVVLDVYIYIYQTIGIYYCDRLINEYLLHRVFIKCGGEYNTIIYNIYIYIYIYIIHRNTTTI